MPTHSASSQLMNCRSQPVEAMGQFPGFRVRLQPSKFVGAKVRVPAAATKFLVGCGHSAASRERLKLSLRGL